MLGPSSVAAVAQARFFGGMSFTADGWSQFADALRKQAAAITVEVEATGWSEKHMATGPIDAPNRRRYKIVSVWIDEDAGLRLVTVHPAKE